MEDKVKGYWHVYSDGKRADMDDCVQRQVIAAKLISGALAGNCQLLDFVGAAGRGRGGVDGYLEEFSAGVKDTNEILFIGFGCLVGYFKGAWGVCCEEAAENLACLAAGAVPLGRDDCYVQIVCEPAGQGCSVSCSEIFGN